MMFISGRLTAAASEIPSTSPVIICCGVSKEVSALLLMLTLTLTISTFFCVWGGVYCHLLPIKMHYCCLTLLLPYIDLFFLARILMTLLRLLMLLRSLWYTYMYPFRKSFLAPSSLLTNSISIYTFMFSLLLLKGVWLLKSSAASYIFQHK